MAKSEYELKNRKIIVHGSSNAVSLPPTVAEKYGFKYETPIRIELRDGICIVTRQGEDPPFLNGETGIFSGLKEDEFYKVQEKSIIKVGNSLGFTIGGVSVTEEAGLTAGTRIKVGFSPGLIMITREGSSLPYFADDYELPKVDEKTLEALKQLTHELQTRAITWIDQRVVGFNRNLRLGEMRARVMIKKNEVVVLNLSRMKIVSLPRSINSESFPALKGLHMEGCRLSNVEFELLAENANLEKIVMAKNRLIAVDLAPITSLTKLTELSLANNQIDYIDLDPIASLAELKSLDLRGNELEDVELNSFEFTTKLEQLYLSNNFIEEIDLTPLKELQKLKIIWLYSNNLEEITLEAPKSIEVLFLNRNELTEIDLTSLAKATKLIWLDLSCNKIAEIDLEPLRNTPIKRLSLYGNPLRDIDLSPLFEHKKLEIFLPSDISEETQKQVKTLIENGNIVGLIEQEEEDAIIEKTTHHRKRSSSPYDEYDRLGRVLTRQRRADRRKVKIIERERSRSSGRSRARVVSSDIVESITESLEGIEINIDHDEIHRIATEARELALEDLELHREVIELEEEELELHREEREMAKEEVLRAHEEHLEDLEFDGHRTAKVARPVKPTPPVEPAPPSKPKPVEPIDEEDLD
ncbi:MAG: leucine-rich repeat domain-containing protein [Candidatus Kariarchaeaceae archaeon]